MSERTPFAYSTNLYKLNRELVHQIESYFKEERAKADRGEKALPLYKFVQRLTLEAGVSKKKVYALIENYLGQSLPVEEKL